jgi:hypothetical protein
MDVLGVGTMIRCLGIQSVTSETPTTFRTLAAKQLVDRLLAHHPIITTLSGPESVHSEPSLASSSFADSDMTSKLVDLVEIHCRLVMSSDTMEWWVV